MEKALVLILLGYGLSIGPLSIIWESLKKGMSFPGVEKTQTWINF
jgi:hypothetical protein